MNLFGILVLLTVFTGYILLLHDQNRFAKSTIYYLEKSKAEFYELEGWIYYAIAFYKSNYKQINLPYIIKKYNKQNYILITILSISDNIIEISAEKYLNQDNSNKLINKFIGKLAYILLKEEDNFIIQDLINYKL